MRGLKGYAAQDAHFVLDYVNASDNDYQEANVSYLLEV